MDTSPHTEHVVEVNGVKLEYLDWGGPGEVLILLHGSGDNPHVFDDLAPAFMDRFHVIAYARRGTRAIRSSAAVRYLDLDGGFAAA